jgi:uroporphyrinogen-III synthase
MRVLLLRPESQAQASAVRLNALGHEALIAPALSIEATDTPPPPGPFAAVIATSSNALPALRNAGGAIALVPAFTVGRRTGVALTEAGFGNVASATDAWSLARLIIDRIMPGRLLLVAGRDRKSEPEGSLREAGFDVAIWETYRACTVGGLSRAARAALAGHKLGAVLHYSRRSAETSIVLAREAGLEAEFRTIRHLCLSVDVAEGLQGLAGVEIEVASRPDEDALLALLSHESQARSRRNRNAKDGTILPDCDCRTANG